MTYPIETVDRDELRRLQARSYSERKLQDEFLKLAADLGWLRAHFRPARTIKGWRTAVQGDGDGFPDTLLLRGLRSVVAELKTEDGTVSAKQRRWLEAFAAAGYEVYVWRPRDLLSGKIAAVLQ